MTSLIDFLEARLAEDEATALRYIEGVNTGVEEGRWLKWLAADETLADYAGHVISYQVLFCAIDHIARHDPARVLREVEAKRAIIAHESAVTLPEWKPDCGGDWVLSGDGFFANYWPDNTVSASITDGFDGPTLADSGIVPKESRAACQAFAEEWIKAHLPERSPVLRAIAAVWPGHPDYNPQWRTT